VGRKLEISSEGISDLGEIWDYIANDSSANADRLVEQVFQKCVEISVLDGIGRPREELYPGLFSISFRKYIIFFQRTDSCVRIIRILHGARDIGAVFND